MCGSRGFSAAPWTPSARTSGRRAPPFGSLSQRFFGDLLSRSLTQFLDRELTNTLGGASTPRSSEENLAIKEAVAQHAYQSALILRQYAQDWYSKSDWQAGGAALTRVLIRCDGAPVPPELKAQEWEQLSLAHYTGDRELTLRIENLSHAVLSNISDRAADLVRIAAYAYAADQSVVRWAPADAVGKRWERTIALSVPVAEPDFWNQAPVRAMLEETLSFVSEDAWQFTFSFGGPAPGQLVMNMGNLEPLYGKPDVVALFSGGADSLCAVADHVAHGST